MTIQEALRLYREGKAILTATDNGERVTMFAIVPTGDALPAAAEVKSE
jgi:uncharacterized protein (DUF1786 family)